METLNEYDMYLQKYLDQGIRGDITLFTEIFKNKLYYYKSERRWVKYNNGVWENVVGNEPLDEILEIAKIYERDFLKFSKEVQVLSEELYGKNKDFIARFFYKESINNDNCFKKKNKLYYMHYKNIVDY